MTKPYDPSDRAERAAQTVLRNFSRLERKYLTMIGERVKAIGRLKPTDMYRLEVLRDIGGDMAQMKRELAKACGMTMHQLEPMLLEAAQASMRFLDGMGSTAPYQENELAITFAAAQYAQTEARMANLSNTTATAQVYQSLVDDAVFALQTGVTDYQSAIRESLRKAAVAGLQADGIYTDENGTRRIAYASGRTKRLDSAVRQNILDGARQLAQLAMEDVGKQIGCDGVEITAHMECAEDHLPYQGRQYSNEEFQRIQDSLRRRIGQWNCRHFVYPIVLGLSEPAYTPQELEQYRQNSTEQITIGNVTKTRYQWTQEQRRLETAIRREKDCAIAAKAAGDDVLRRECQRKINAYRAQYNQVSRAAALDVRNDKMAVSGFARVKTVEQLQETAQRKAIYQAKESIRIGRISKTINPEKQARHMVGQKGYIDGRSAITLPLEELQELVNRYAGTGKIEVVDEKITEKVDFQREVGYTVSDIDGNVETTFVKLHYSKTGIHVVPLFGGKK